MMPEPLKPLLWWRRGRWYQIRPNTPLFQLDNDHIAIEKLPVVRTGLGIRITTKAQNGASKASCENSVNQSWTNKQPNVSCTFHRISCGCEIEIIVRVIHKLKNSNLWSDSLRTKLTYTYKNLHTITKLKIDEPGPNRNLSALAARAQEKWAAPQAN
jgi:hypothetical protein